MTDFARLAAIIIRILAAATMLYSVVRLVFQALVLGLVLMGDQAVSITIGPILALIVAALVFRNSRGLGAWLAQGV